MAAAVMTAPFQDIGEPDKIGVHVGMRIDQRMTHPCLRREVNDIGKTMLGKERRCSVAVRQIELGEPEFRMFRKPADTIMLQLWIVIGIQIVKADDLAAIVEQPLGDVKADEPGGAGHQNGIYKRHSSIPFGCLLRSSFDLTSSTVPCRFLRRRVIKSQPSAT